MSEGARPTRLSLTSSFGPLLLFIFFQVNTVVSYFLDYVEDIYIMVVLSVLVPILNPNPMYLPQLVTLLYLTQHAVINVTRSVTNTY